MFNKFCDLNPNVLRWGSEEFCVNYIKPTDGKVHRYFPDYILKIKTKDNVIETWVVEIKPYAQSVPPVVTPKKRKKTLLEEQATFLTNQAKWKAMKAYCDKVGWKFRVVTEKDLGI